MFIAKNKFKGMKQFIACSKKKVIKEKDNSCPSCGAKLAECAKPAMYVTERVVNIRELENYIQEAHLSICSLIRGIEIEELSDVNKVAKILRRIDDVLVKAYDFDFCVERRTTVCK